MTSFTDRFGGITLYPSDLGYQAYSLTTSTSLTWPELGNTSSNLAASFIRASSTVTGAGFIMPDARDVSVGRAERIKNIGSLSIPVFSTSGSTIATIAAGQDYLLSLIDNSTSGGLWDTEQIGVGTSSADAAFLAGNGLTTSGSKLVVNWPTYFTGSNGFQLTATSDGVVNTWTGGAGGWSIAIDGGTVRNGWTTAVKNNGTGILTVSGSVIDTIDGGAIMLGPNDSAFIMSAGISSGYYTVGLTNANSAQYLSISISNRSSTTLNAAQAGNSIIVVTGTPASSPEFTLIFPQSPSEYTVVNQVTNNTTPRAGCGFIIVQTSAVGGRSVKIYAGTSRKIINDGTNIYFSDDMTVRKPARNYLYYADFSTNPWQRGTTFTCSGTSMYIADRVMLATSGTWTATRATSAASGGRYDLRIQRSAGNSTAFLGFDLDIPESIQLRDKPVTMALEMSFSGTTIPTIFPALYTNTSGNQKITDFAWAATQTNWSFVQSIGTAIITTASPTIYYQFVTNPTAYGSSFTGVPSAANQVSLYLQMVLGTGASDMVSISRVGIVENEFDGFDALPPEDVITRCQKFAWVPTFSTAGQTILGGQAVSANGASIPVTFPAPMRTVPALTVTSANFQVTTSTGAASTVSTLTFTGGTTAFGELTVVTVSSLLAAGNYTRLQSATSVATLLFSADI